MELEFKLVEVDVKKTKDKEIPKFIYIPTKQAYSKDVKLTIGGENSLPILSNLGLPPKLDDTVVFTIGKKTSQSSISTTKKKVLV